MHGKIAKILEVAVLCIAANQQGVFRVGLGKAVVQKRPRAFRGHRAHQNHAIAPMMQKVRQRLPQVAGTFDGKNTALGLDFDVKSVKFFKELIEPGKTTGKIERLAQRNARTNR